MGTIETRPARYLETRQKRSNGPDFAEFKNLRISAPLESTKYSFMSMFLARVLNLTDENMILDPSSYKGDTSFLPMEILPRIAVPDDLWLHAETGIDHLLSKIALLKDVNEMLAQGIDELAKGQYLTIDEEKITSFEDMVEKLNLNHFYTTESENQHDPLREGRNDELDSENTREARVHQKTSPTDVQLARIPTSSSSVYSSQTISNNTRYSQLTREVKTIKRKVSLFGLHQQPAKSEPLAIVPIDDRMSLYSEVESINSSMLHSVPSQRSSVNALLSKSKLYKKLVKKRESQTLNSSRVTGSSSNTLPFYKVSSGGFYHLGNLEKLSPEEETRRIENQWDKYNFYLELKSLGEHIQILASSFGKRGSQRSLVMLMEFVKNYVFKFVVVDICRMVTAKCDVGFIP